MRIAVIIPDRLDRPNFLAQCKKMLDYQTIKPDAVFLINYLPKSEKPDITQRYRTGYERVSELNIKHPESAYDVIFFIENDDFYKPDYIETMLSMWELNGKPDLFGTSYTTYYHVGLRAFFNFNHPTRASMMNTMIKPNLDIIWPPDHEVFTDMHLWTRDRCLEGSKQTWTPNAQISIGIKHGVGMCGGRQHTTGLQRFTINGGLGNEAAGGHDDSELKWLSQHVKDEDILNFYKSFNQ